MASCQLSTPICINSTKCAYLDPVSLLSPPLLLCWLRVARLATRLGDSCTIMPCKFPFLISLNPEQWDDDSTAATLLFTSPHSNCAHMQAEWKFLSILAERNFPIKITCLCMLTLRCRELRWGPANGRLWMCWCNVNGNVKCDDIIWTLNSICACHYDVR